MRILPTIHTKLPCACWRLTVSRAKIQHSLLAIDGESCKDSKERASVIFPYTKGVFRARGKLHFKNFERSHKVSTNIITTEPIENNNERCTAFTLNIQKNEMIQLRGNEDPQLELWFKNRKEKQGREDRSSFAALTVLSTNSANKNREKGNSKEGLAWKTIPSCSATNIENAIAPRRLEPGWKTTYKSSLRSKSPSRPSHSQKESYHQQHIKIFSQAREPVSLLYQELKDLRKERKSHPRWSLEYEILDEQIKHLLNHLIPEAEKVASEKVWSGMNPRGSAGYYKDQTCSVGVLLKADFHGQYVAEAIQKFNSECLPKIPYFKRVELIVGRGTHCRKGATPKLGMALLKHIQDLGFKVRVSERNPGLLVVTGGPKAHRERECKI